MNFANQSTLGIGIPPLDVTQKNFDWEIYKMRLEQFFETMKKDADDNAKKNILITLCTDQTLNLLRSLSSPKLPKELTYNELSGLIDSHFTLPVIVYQERKKFYEAGKDEEESVAQYLLKLRTMASTCKFGERQEGNIVDKFVTGMNGKIYQRLCEEENWTAEKALEVAKKYEMNLSDNQSAVNFIKQNKKYAARSTVDNRKSASGNESCKHCGFTNHKSEKCRYKNFTCNRCGCKGHMAYVCNERSKESQNVIKAISTDVAEDENNCKFKFYCNSSDEKKKFV